MSKQKDEVYYNALDKRTKEYKEWKEKQPLKGIGDVVEKVFKKTGIAKAAKFLLGEDCKCDERRDTLNKIWPFRKIKCLEENEYDFLHLWFSKTRYKITSEEHNTMVKIYNRVFNTKTEVEDCSSCIKLKVQELNKLYLEYNPKENDVNSI